MSDLLNKTIPELHEMLKTRKIGYEELASEVINNTKVKDSDIQAYITTTSEEALVHAKGLDSNKTIPDHFLTGIPLSVKDSLTTQGVKTTVASKILENFVPPYDATSYARLKESGTILMGKANMDEFAHGFTTEYSAFGPTKNPWNTDYVPGGSSGGSAASVAAREALLSLATENYGSIIQPSSLCGVVGMKPTYGRSSRYGIIAMASSLECPGIIGRCVEDVAIGIEAISGPDPLDATSVNQKVPPFFANLSADVSGFAIAVIDPIMELVPDELSSAILSAIDTFKKLNATSRNIPWYDLESDSAIYDVLYRAEVSSNLARYDGIRYGHSGDRTEALEDFYLSSRDAFGKHVKRQITTDPITLGEGNDDVYLDALRLRRRNRAYIDELFEKFTAIVTPATVFSELRLGETADQTWREKNRNLAKVTAAMVCPTVLYGYPTISFPIGFTKNRMPIGVNLYAKRFNEQALFDLAYAYQKETELKCLKPDTI